MSKFHSPVKSIRLKCLECTDHHPKEIRNCTITDCALYPYRLGRNPNRKGIGPKKGPIFKKRQVESAIITKKKGSAHG